MKIKILLVLFLIFELMNLNGQNAPFNIKLSPVSIKGLSGIQAYAYGQFDGKWLIVGGRIDGLHMKQPFASFDEEGRNINLIVVDPAAEQQWTAPLTSLPISIQEQLSSTNMEFYQQANMLYCMGGYGYSGTNDDHITYNKLTAINVPSVINSIIGANSFTNYFRQISDTMFAVTGGYLNKIYDTYYLTGGQKFDGRYNPMGPDHGPGFSQVYTNAIRKFKINDDGINLSIVPITTITDVANLHRRDFNVVAQIMPDGQEGLTAFSGVFQHNIDVPFLNCVNIDTVGYFVNNSFSQYYNQYHCAHIPLYSAVKNEMHTLFFGGISQYYDSLGILVQNNNVPFVKTIARVTRKSDGIMSEYKLPVEMPQLLGASSEFIPKTQLPKYENDVLKLDEISEDTTLLGYIFGGIHSTAPNIFWVNDGTQSDANKQLFKVYLIKNSPTMIHELNKQSNGLLHLQVYPNPNNGELVLNFYLNVPTDVLVSIFDVSGKLIDKKDLKNLTLGSNSFTIKIKNTPFEGIYFVTLETEFEKATQKIIIEP